MDKRLSDGTYYESIEHKPNVWITHRVDYDTWGECSNCGGIQSISSSLPFCPWCGSHMNGGKIDVQKFTGGNYAAAERT